MSSMGARLCAHLFRRSRDEDWVAIEYLEKYGHEMVQEHGVLLTLTVGLDVIPDIDRLCAFDPKVCAQSASALQ